MSSGEQVTIALFALLIVSKLIDWVLAFTRGQQKQEQADAAERGRWMDMLETVLDKQQDKFKGLADIFKDGLDASVQAMQTNTTTALDQLVARVEGRVTASTTARDAKLELMHTDIKTVPAEVQRLLGEDHQELIKEAVCSALKPVLAQIEEKLDQLPGETASRQIIREEVQALQQLVVERVTGQITPLLDKLDEIVAALDTLRPTPVSSLQATPEAGDQVPVDTSIERENDHVGNPS